MTISDSVIQSLLQDMNNTYEAAKQSAHKVSEEANTGSADSTTLGREIGVPPVDELCLVTNQTSQAIAQQLYLLDLTVKRLSSFSQQNLGAVSSEIDKLLGGLANVGRKVVDIVAGLFGAKSKTSAKVKAALDGYKAHTEEAARIVGAVTSLIAVMPANGNDITQTAGHKVFIQNALFSRSDTLTSIDSPLLELVSDVMLVNAGRMVSVGSNVWQGVHYYLNFNVKHSVAISTKTTSIISSLAYKRVSAEDEVVAGTRISYADVVFNQAGQTSNIRLNPKDPDSSVNYGSLVNIALNNQAHVARRGVMALKAGTAISLDGKQVYINCSFNRALTASIKLKSYPMINDKGNSISETNAAQPLSTVYKGDYKACSIGGAKPSNLGGEF